MLKSKRKISLFEIIIGCILVLYCVAFVVLFVWALCTSLKTSDEFMKNPSGLLNSFNIKNFIDVFNKISYNVTTENGIFPKYYESMLLYSVLYAGGSAFFQVFCTAIVAYCTSKYQNKVSTIVNYVVIITLILPIVGNTPSMISLMKTLGLYNTMFGAWIMKFGFNNMYYLIFYAAFKGLSWSYAESAFIDGASHFTVFFKIMLPLMINLVGTVFLLLFIEYWNDYQTPMFYLPDYRTAAYGLFVIYSSTTGEMSFPPIKIAGGIVVFLPIFVLFLCFRNKIMGNLTEGGIKG